MTIDPNPPFIVCTQPNGRRLIIMLRTIRGVVEAATDDHEGAGCIIQTNDGSPAYAVGDSFQEVLDTLYRIYRTEEVDGMQKFTQEILRKFQGEDLSGIV